MARRLLSRVGGFVHDINTVASLSDEPNNVRLLSDRSLYILQNLSQEDITFLSRYGVMITGDLYLPVLPGSAEASDVEDAIDLIRRDLNSMAIDDLLECVCEAVRLLGEQGASGSQEIESTMSDGEVSVGEGQQFPDQEAYFDAKCNVANGIYDTVLGTVTWLKDNDIDLLAGVFGGVTSGLIVGLLGAGPLGWATVLVGSVLAGMAGFLIKYSLSFEDLEDALVDVHDESVLALYNASNSVTAEAEFLAAIESSSVPTTPIERGLVALMLTSDVLNQLFAPRSDVAVYASPSPVDCGGALLQVWTFLADVEGWTFRDDSVPPSTASGAYDAGDEALAVTMTAAGGGSRPKTEGTWFITGLAIVAPSASSLQIDFSETSDGVTGAGELRLIFSDATELFWSGEIGIGAGVKVLTMPEAKTVEEVEISFARTTVTPGTYTRDLLEVRIVGV